MQPNHPKFDVTFKIVFLGESGVGKTSILNTFMNQEFREENISTIGIEYLNKTIEVQGKKVQLEIWDTAGQERFHSIAPIYYRKANAVLLVYDITNRQSFERAKVWLQELESNGNPNALTVVLGNKTDMESKRDVNLNEAVDLIKKNRLKGYDVTAKDVDMINSIFKKVVKRLLKRYNMISGKKTNGTKVDLKSQGAEKKEAGGCCGSG